MTEAIQASQLTKVYTAPLGGTPVRVVDSKRCGQHCPVHRRATPLSFWLFWRRSPSPHSGWRHRS